MHILRKRKDGGKTSPVDAYFLCEFKNLFSVALLKFNKGGREEYHTHAFDAYTIFLKGNLVEEDVDGSEHIYRRGKLKFTPKSKNHRVSAKEDSWCFTLRGPWVDSWTEYNVKDNLTTFFTHGRKVVHKCLGVYSK